MELTYREQLQNQAASYRSQGLSVDDTIKKMGISRSSYYRYIKASGVSVESSNRLPIKVISSMEGDGANTHIISGEVKPNLISSKKKSRGDNIALEGLQDLTDNICSTLDKLCQKT